MITNGAAVHAAPQPYSHPSVVREHKLLIRLCVTILRNRGFSEERAAEEADGLLRHIPPGKEPACLTKPRSMAG
jgi:hypothetical protein